MTKYKVRYQDLIAEDLKQIGKFLERFPDAAPFKTVRELIEEIDKLEDLPNSHRRLDENQILRKLNVGKYSVLYQVDDERKAVQVEYIFHQSRDIKRVLARETPTLAKEFELDFAIEEEEEELEF